MRFLIGAIRDALKKDCLIPALMSSLAIPDAMGQCLYPNLVLDNGKRAAGRQYAKWFDSWAANDFLFLEDPSNEGKTIPGQIFNGKMCWKLRCSLLHSGDYDVPVDAPEKDESFDYVYKFELVLHGCNALCSSWPSPENGERTIKSIVFRVDAASLASSLCDAAEACLKETGETVSYPDLKVFDVAAWANRFNAR